MIVGTFLRYFKTYQGLNFIPLTDEDKFCGLVGDNGIGKSSVLESLDTFFNSRQWNFNTSTKKSGLATTRPIVVPVFLVPKSYFNGDDLALAELLDKVARGIGEESIPPASRAKTKQFIEVRDNIIARSNTEELLFIPIGINHEAKLSLTIFNCELLVNEYQKLEAIDNPGATLGDDILIKFTGILEKLRSKIDYIYIPKEIDPETFTQLETTEIQVLMGETLNQILERTVTTGQIRDINSSLNHFLKELSDEFQLYSYRTPTDRQQNLRKQDVYNLIIQAFFNIRKLHKKQGDAWLEINALSSGEKQKAIIDVAYSLITEHRADARNLIIAVDEPESSLHMSACFEQFEALHNISRKCMQVLFSSHWYGFLPTMTTGSVTIISKENNNHVFDMINLASYREQIKQARANSQGRLPYDIRLKSINDFIQSIITSAVGEAPYNWLICEGSSEKIYFQAYFKDLVENDRLRIVPVGGAKEIKRIYQHIQVAYRDFNDEVSGKIYLVSDTDAELVEYDTSSESNLVCKRLIYAENTGKVSLVNIKSNPKSPRTEIEDSLNAKVFLETLKSFIEVENDLDFLTDLEASSEESPRIALDLKRSDWKAIEAFFDKDNNKFLFAERYVSKLDENYSVPEWINEISTFLSEG